MAAESHRMSVFGCRHLSLNGSFLSWVLVSQLSEMQLHVFCRLNTCDIVRTGSISFRHRRGLATGECERSPRLFHSARVPVSCGFTGIVLPPPGLLFFFRERQNLTIALPWYLLKSESMAIDCSQPIQKIAQGQVSNLQNLIFGF